MFDSTDIATVISICGLCMPPMQMLVYPRLAGKLGARDTFGALSWLLCICLLTLPFTSPLHAGGEGGIWSPNGIALVCNYLALALTHTMVCLRRPRRTHCRHRPRVCARALWLLPAIVSASCLNAVLSTFFLTSCLTAVLLHFHPDKSPRGTIDGSIAAAGLYKFEPHDRACRWPALRATIDCRI